MQRVWSCSLTLGGQLETVIEPGDAVEQVLLALLFPDFAHDFTFESADVVPVVPEITGFVLHPRGPQIARVHILLERRLDLIAGPAVEQFGETHRILDRHTRALGEALQRRMCGVAEQRNTAP